MTKVELFKHVQVNIKTIEDLLGIHEVYQRIKPIYFGFDTETNGLNIKYNKPFALGFGFVDLKNTTIYTYTLDLEKEPQQLIWDGLYVFDKIVKAMPHIIGHNITFDMHMMANIGHPITEWEKLRDTMLYIRLTHPSLNIKEGGAPTALKDYSARYIDQNARYHEKKLKEEQQQLRSRNTQELKDRLKFKPLPEEYKVTGKEKAWNKNVIDKFFDDPINEIENLPLDVQEIIRDWKNNTIDPDDYSQLNRDNVIKYLHKDVYYTLMIYLTRQPYIKIKSQEETLKREERAIKGFYILEQPGQVIDMELLKEYKERTKSYIIKLREELYQIFDIKVKVNQHQLIKDILSEKYKIDMDSTDQQHIKLAIKHPEVPEETKRALSIILELRSIEKWYVSYILKYLEETNKYNTDTIYPTYNAAGTVTGRVSSDFQQVPKFSQYTIDNEELVTPRKLFKVPNGNRIYYFDYAAMEMRLLANYTILVSGGDLNLCRVFIPFKCIKKDGEHYLEEAPYTKWEPLDPHGMTTKDAFDIDETHPKFSEYRRIGKMGNFAIIYGATPEKISQNMNIPLELARKIYNAFFKNFKGVRDYNSYVERYLRENNYIENLLGRKYFGINAHKGKNYLIQGSGADYTKELLRQLVDLLEDKKSKIVLYLHDEFAFIIDKEEEYLIKDIKEIMEQMESPIKMLVDVEYSDTNWKEKKNYEL